MSLAAALAVGACSGGLSGGGAPLTLPAIPSLDTVAALATPEPPPVGSATELYARVARGAVNCWFGANGQLKKSYIYHAEADAASRGGKAEIVVHVREPGPANPRGPKAFRINIDPTSESAATVKTENLKMPEPVAAAMTSDVGRWSRGDQGCAGATTTAGSWQDAPQKTADTAAGPPAKPGKKALQKKPAASP